MVSATSLAGLITCTFSQVHIYMHIHVHACIHIHVNIHTCVFVQKSGFDSDLDLGEKGGKNQGLWSVIKGAGAALSRFVVLEVAGRQGERPGVEKCWMLSHRDFHGSLHLPHAQGRCCIDF